MNLCLLKLLRILLWNFWNTFFINHWRGKKSLKSFRSALNTYWQQKTFTNTPYSLNLFYSLHFLYLFRRCIWLLLTISFLFACNGHRFVQSPKSIALSKNEKWRIVTRCCNYFVLLKYTMYGFLKMALFRALLAIFI